jgi:hypothetical protein
LRIKEQETCLTLQEHDDDDDDEYKVTGQLNEYIQKTEQDRVGVQETKCRYR